MKAKKVRSIISSESILEEIDLCLKDYNYGTVVSNDVAMDIMGPS